MKSTCFWVSKGTPRQHCKKKTFKKALQRLKHGVGFQFCISKWQKPIGLYIFSKEIKTIGHFVHSKVIETIANSLHKHPSSSKDPLLPSRSKKEVSERFEKVCHSLTVRCTWNIARRAKVDFYTSAQLSRDAPVHDARPTRQSHPAAYVRDVFSFKRVALVVTPPTTFKTLLTHKQRSASWFLRYLVLLPLKVRVF